MSGVSLLYAIGIGLWLRHGEVPIQGNLLQGASSLWSPGPIVTLLVIWVAMVVTVGISTTTFSRIEFLLHEDRL